MNNEQALIIIKQACASVQANLETHQHIQSAIQYIEIALTLSEEDKDGASTPTRKDK